MFRTIVTADIGATNARFAILTRSPNGKPSISTAQVYLSSRYETLDLVVNQFFADKEINPDALILALPGPVIQGCCKTTNLPWNVCVRELEKVFQIPVFLLNDLEAQAWGIDCLVVDKLVPIYSGHTPAHGNRAIIAPGSDLGEAVLYWDGKHYHPFSTEGGHCDFSATTSFDHNLCRLLEEQYGYARWGHILSGPGVANIYRLVSKDADCCITGEQVGELYRQGDTAAVEAIQHFFRLLGRECANLALKAMGTGGIYISGGIVPKLHNTSCEGMLVQSFLSRPSMQSLVDACPIFLVRDADLGLIGAANFLWHQSDHH